MFMNIPNLSNSRGFPAGNPARSNNNCLESEAIDNKGKAIRSDFNSPDFGGIADHVAISNYGEFAIISRREK